MKKKKVIILGSIGLIIMLLGIILMICMHKEESIRFEDYYLKETNDFLEDFNSYTENGNRIYEKKATFLDYEGTAYFVRDEATKQFVANSFEMKLNSKLNEETIEKENIGILDKTKEYLNYDGLLDIHCISTKEGVNINYDKSVMRLLIDKEADIYFDFYPENKMFEYILTNKENTIYALLKYDGKM